MTIVNKVSGTYSVGSTIREALKIWKNKTNQDLRTAEQISLEYQSPPILKIGMSIKQLVNCKVLSLACNMIERPTMLCSLKNLRTLNLSRNNLRTLSGIECLGKTLEELWVSYNLINKLKPIESMKALKILYISHNNIKEWAEIKCVAVPQDLQEISFFGNPVQQSMSEERFRREIAKRLPNLKKMDFVPILRNETEEI